MSQPKTDLSEVTVFEGDVNVEYLPGYTAEGIFQWGQQLTFDDIAAILAEEADAVSDLDAAS